MNAGVHILPASREDVAAILELENNSFGEDAFTRRQIQYLLTRAKGAAFVAKNGARLAGYVSILVSDRHQSGRIYSIAVDPAYRGQGIADLLTDRAIAYVRAQNLRAVFLEVRADNQAAICLYLKKGFRQRLIKPDYYHGGTQALSMVLDLSR